jgi:hypothetical protein
MASHFNIPLDVFEMKRRRKVSLAPSPPYVPCCFVMRDAEEVIGAVVPVYHVKLMMAESLAIIST